MPATILLVDTAPSVSRTLQESLCCHGVTVRWAHDKSRLLQLVHGRDLDFIVLGPSLADTNVLPGFAGEIRDHGITLPLVLTVVKSSEELAICALRSGVNEYIKASSPEELARAVVDYLSRNLARRDLGRQFAIAANARSALIGDSVPMREIKSRLSRIAASGSSVLITGETGTGKELVAQYLHQASPRRHQPFITINCAAIPDSLLESELFGYEKGSFTGAAETNPGKFKSADGGTVFLDEIGDMTPFAQAKILRVVEAKEVQRLGKSSSISVNLRIIAATNQDLERLVESGKFRKDLFFRLNVTNVRLPPLRERRQDIPELIQYYLHEFNALYGRNIQRLSDQALHYFLAHDFPGNVRELKNLVEAIFVDLPLADVQVGDLPSQIRPISMDLTAELAHERDQLLDALLTSNWNKSKAAQKLDWSRMTLYRKMSRYNIRNSVADESVESVGGAVRALLSDAKTGTG
jgi:DNA-binding NtrC family response regulator